MSDEDSGQQPNEQPEVATEQAAQEENAEGEHVVPAEGGEESAVGEQAADVDGEEPQPEQASEDAAAPEEPQGTEAESEPLPAEEQLQNTTEEHVEPEEKPAEPEAENVGEAEGNAESASAEQPGENATEASVANDQNQTARTEGEAAEQSQPAAEQVEGGELEEGEERPHTTISEPTGEDDYPNTMSEDFYYDYEELVSKPVVTADSYMPPSLLTLYHSFGYDCKRRANLHLLSEDIICFIAGNLVAILNTRTAEQTYLRSLSGGGIGSIAVHHSKKYLAVAEKGNAPSINIYEYPSLRLFRMLRGGTQHAYAHIAFSPNGRLLASVGSDPDYMLTIWNWRNEQVVLRSKAFSQDVYRVSWATELEGVLTTVGAGHIRFWKMARTFTGLKLHGEIGKFGRTEISDIEGLVELPDGKVLTGCEWGNMLLWDGGLIKVEICRKGRRRCHLSPIQQIIFEEGELITVGQDGMIRVWDFETVDNAEATDEAGMFEMEPMNELRVGTDVQLRGIQKCVTDGENVLWFAQDAKGGVFKLDLSFSFTSFQPQRILSFHAGPIRDACCAPGAAFTCTAGSDGSLRIYDYTAKKYVARSEAPRGARAVMWLPSEIDAKTRTVVAGFDDGVLRTFQFLERNSELDVPGRRSKDGVADLLLAHAVKPHRGAVCAIALEPRRRLLVTAGEDKTLFFFTINHDAEYEPRGYMELPGPAVRLQFLPDEESDADTERPLIVFCRDGVVVQITPPYGTFAQQAPDSQDSNTFKLDNIPMRFFRFASIKSHLRHEEELERQRREEEALRAAQDEEYKRLLERGQITEEELANLLAERDVAARKRKQQEADEWEPYVPLEPSPIVAALCADEPGSFWLSLGAFDAGYLYKCRFKKDADSQLETSSAQPHSWIAVTDSNDVPITSIDFSNNGRLCLLGMHNGVVRVHAMRTPSRSDLSQLGPYFCLAMHDNHYGAITRLFTSYDDLHVLSVGEDGNFFVFDLLAESQYTDRPSLSHKVPSARRDELRLADDIDDPNAYTLEDAKQKAEYDRMVALAEERKDATRKEIARMRRQFKKLLAQNEELPKHLQLDRREFELDRSFREQVANMRTEKLEQVRKEMAFEAEKSLIALEKLRMRFKGLLQHELVTLRAFLTDEYVTTFRLANLSKDFVAMKSDLERRQTMASQAKDSLSKSSSVVEKAPTSKISEDSEKQATEPITSILRGSNAERVAKALAKVEERRRRRAQRRAEWDALNIRRPTDDYEDERDVAAIREARENIGDYKLKTASDYVIPSHLRMNVDKARYRLMLLRELLFQMRYEFNTRVFALRDRKRAVIARCLELTARLHTEVHPHLAVAERRQALVLPAELSDGELPERMNEITKEKLTRFKAELKEREQQARSGVESLFTSTALSKPTAVAKQTTDTAQTALLASFETLADDIENDAECVFVLPIVEEQSVEQTASVSAVEAELDHVQRVRAAYEQDTILREMNELVEQFDAELRCARHTRAHLEADVKRGELRQLVFFEELVLLRDFEKRENVLTSRLDQRINERNELAKRVTDVQARLDTKKREVDKLQERGTALFAEFVAAIGGDQNKFADFLTRVFKKRVKRKRGGAGQRAGKADGEAGGGESSESEEEESDDDDDAALDEFDEEEMNANDETAAYDLDVCPPGCDAELYEKTVAMRDRRLDIDEQLTEEKKQADTLRKELEGLTKKQKIVDQTVTNAETELELFQTEKQARLNEIETVVVLNLHQIILRNSLLEGASKAQPELDSTLVFEYANLMRLQRRTRELDEEIEAQKRAQKAARSRHRELVLDRAVFETNIGELQTVNAAEMRAKFGREVDLEALEQVTVNRQLEEIREKVRRVEGECERERNIAQLRIGDKRTLLTDSVRTNTCILQELAAIGSHRSKLESALDARQTALGNELRSAANLVQREHDRLVQLVELQAQEVDALREEITLLSRKGGHILPPAASNQNTMSTN